MLKFAATLSTAVLVVCFVAVSQTVAIDLKLPWTAGETWEVTVGYNGYCVGYGCPDEYHTDANNGYFALDFDDPNASPGSGLPILAAASGIVVFAGGDYNVGFGYYVKIDHGSGYQTLYGHLKEWPMVNVGDYVQQGEQLGRLGSTGWSTGDHLHFSVFYNGNCLSSVLESKPEPISGFTGIEYGQQLISDNYAPTYSATSTTNPQTPTYPPGLDYYPVAQGQILPVEFIFNNDGTAYWTNDVTSSHYVELHSVNSSWTADEASNLKYNWLDANGVRIATTTGNVDPGGQGLYRFEILAPDVPGDYWLYTALYRPHTSDHFSEPGPVLHIRVNDTEISGNVSGTLYAADSPYKVVGHLSVPSGQTLVIEPGCEFIFQGHYKFIVNSGATLLAIGTETDSIRFTAVDHTDGWHGIRFLNASSDSRLEYCVIEYGNAYPDAGWNHWGGGVFCYYSSPTITHCLVRFNKALGGGIAIAHSSPVISQCTITNNQATGRGGGGILSYASWSTITGNQIANNTSSYHGGGMSVEYGSAIVSDNIFTGNYTARLGGGLNGRLASITAIGNEFNGNSATTGGGIQMEGGNAEISNNVISGNYVSQYMSWWQSFGAGIALENVTGMISNNIITDNIVGNSTRGGSGGGGIYCGNNQAEIYGNEIYNNNGKYNGGGIYVRRWAAPNIHHNNIYGNRATYGGGISVENANPLISLNSIYDNSANSGAGIRNHTPSYATVNAINNWWGDASGPYNSNSNPDGAGNSVSDYVNYQPWRLYSSTVNELIAETEALLPEGFFSELTIGEEINQGQSSIIDLLIDAVSEVWQLILNWPGSELNLKVYQPDGSLYGEWQSAESPIVTDIVPTDTGTWSFEVTAIDVPNDNYPFALVVGSLPLGSISGTVTDVSSSNGLAGVTVDLYSQANELLGYYITDQLGNYSFSDLLPGQYDVTLISPLGYTADAESKSTTVVSEVDSVVNFTLTALEIIPSQRSMGFWKHQVNVHLSGKGNAHVSLEELCSYMDLVRSHFNENLASPVTIFEVAQPAVQEDSLQALQVLLTVNKNGAMNDRAKQQLTALLLNVVSGKLSQADVSFSEDGATVSQAITYCHTLITDAEPENDQRAKDIAELLNEGQTVPAGWIDLAIPNIAYKQTDDALLPAEFSLWQNYPNPFNPSTSITYSLPKSAHVKLVIYNILGQNITTLVDKQQEAGIYNVHWNSSDYASGIYFYRIVAGEHIQTKKMLLLK